MPHIGFKYLKNVMLSFGDGRYYAIPCTIRATPISAPGIQPMPGTQNVDPAFQTFDRALGMPTAPMPVFDLDFIHRIELADVSPRVPKRRPEWSDAFYAAVETQAHTDAIAARAKIAGVLQMVKHHVKQGNIEVVQDSDALLEDEFFELSDAEKAIAGIKVDDKKRDPNVVNVNELVAEGKALANVGRVKK